VTARRTMALGAEGDPPSVSDPESPLLTREWLVTNGIGGYASGTISGNITRRFHGLLIASLPAPLGRTMMLNHVAELARLDDGTSFTLDAQRRSTEEGGAGCARARLADFIITTAQVPGRPAPRLITVAMVGDMKAGSVIVDLAAESGGNCELTQAGQTVRHNGVTILGPTNLPATLPLDASRMLARNLATFILEITNENGFTLDWQNEIFAETCITLNGEINQKRRTP